MRKQIKGIILGYLGFLLLITFNVSIAIWFYSQIEYKSNWQIALLIFVLILINAFWCTLIEITRRKIMVERPLKEILKATKAMSKGNFKIHLLPKHNYESYDEFDYIKEDINELAKELSNNEVLKNDFIANISHEIKTPLSIIKGYAKTLEDSSLDEESRNIYLKKMQKACDKLNNLVMNILKLNKLENQKNSFEISNINLSELLISQVISFEELIEKKNINLECDIEENLFINSEQSYLEIVFSNLLSNAIKFTNNEGTIKVYLRKINDEYIIKVQDTGCGIDKETGKHIFDKFYQGDTSHSKAGNGLGLALVKKVIEILGGTINVESEKGVGSIFKVVIKEVKDGQ